MLKFLSLPSAGTLIAVAMGAAALPQDQPVFKAQSELVVLHVMVKDRKGAYVGGLTADAFHVSEEKRPQAIRFFAAEDAPVTVGLVIDSSGSMAHARDRVIAASTAFVESSNPQDEVFGIVFNDDVRSVLTASARFTSDANTLRGALAAAFVPSGRTTLYDAIVNGLAYVATGTRDRRVLVVLSDGGDNASLATFADALTKTQASNVVIYTIALIDLLDAEANPNRLRQFAEASGGAAFAPGDIASVERAFEQIAHDIRHSYTIGYEPSSTDRRPGFHRIRVDVQSPDGRRLVTRSREGYYAQ
jgi:Ca-activated chloride channel family protein